MDSTGLEPMILEAIILCGNGLQHADVCQLIHLYGDIFNLIIIIIHGIVCTYQRRMWSLRTLNVIKNSTLSVRVNSHQSKVAGKEQYHTMLATRLGTESNLVGISCDVTISNIT